MDLLAVVGGQLVVRRYPQGRRRGEQIVHDRSLLDLLPYRCRFGTSVGALGSIQGGTAGGYIMVAGIVGGWAPWTWM